MDQCRSRFVLFITTLVYNFAFILVNTLIFSCYYYQSVKQSSITELLTIFGKIPPPRASPTR